MEIKEEDRGRLIGKRDTYGDDVSKQRGNLRGRQEGRRVNKDGKAVELKTNNS